jgi:2-phospho-L-lactate guanylyltransferase (CobY/MobA/RfbA family)
MNIIGPVDHDLYRVSPAYRQAIDELHILRSKYGAMAAAYENAINDQRRLRRHFAAAMDQIDEVMSRFAVAQRDDPGRGGSGGE